MKYKFRAKSYQHFTELKKYLPKGEPISKVIHPLQDDLPDVIVTIELTNTSLDKLRDLMRKVTDGQVMLQTVALENDYTGDRDYDLQ